MHLPDIMNSWMYKINVGSLPFHVKFLGREDALNFGNSVHWNQHWTCDIVLGYVHHCVLSWRLCCIAVDRENKLCSSTSPDQLWQVHPQSGQGKCQQLLQTSWAVHYSHLFFCFIFILHRHHKPNHHYYTSWGDFFFCRYETLKHPISKFSCSSVIVKLMRWLDVMLFYSGIELSCSLTSNWTERFCQSWPSTNPRPSRCVLSQHRPTQHVLPTWCFKTIHSEHYQSDHLNSFNSYVSQVKPI